MKGQVLHYDVLAGTGQISGEDGRTYGFQKSDLKQSDPIGPGTSVYFDTQDGRAFDIYVLRQARVQHHQSAVDHPKYDQGFLAYGADCLINNFAKFSGRAGRREYWSMSCSVFLSVLIFAVLNF